MLVESEKFKTAKAIEVNNCADNPELYRCPRCKQYVNKHTTWFMDFDGNEIQVCDRCHDVLFIDGWTDDFGMRYFDKQWLETHPDVSKEKFKAIIAEAKY